MKELLPHLVKAGLSVATIALGTYLGFVLYEEFGKSHDASFTAGQPHPEAAAIRADFSSYMTAQ